MSWLDSVFLSRCIVPRCYNTIKTSGSEGYHQNLRNNFSLVILPVKTIWPLGVLKQELLVRFIVEHL
jgi:hypothetical protein